MVVGEVVKFELVVEEDVEIYIIVDVGEFILVVILLKLLIVVIG